MSVFGGQVLKLRRLIAGGQFDKALFITRILMKRWPGQQEQIILMEIMNEADLLSTLERAVKPATEPAD